MQNLQNHGHSWDSVVPYHYVPVHTIKTYRGSKGTNPFVLNLCINWSWVVNLCPPTAAPLGKELPIPNECSFRSWKLLSWSQNCHVDPVVFISQNPVIFTPYSSTAHLRGGADKSLAWPTSRCRRTQSIVSLERGVCWIASLFLL